MAVARLKVDRELQALIPPLSPDERAQLEASLLAEGCRDPLVVWKGHGILLDGHNRYELCGKHGLRFSTTEVALPDREAAKAFLIRNQLARRNLTPEAASYLRGRRYLELRHQGKRIDRTSGHEDPKLKGRRLSEVLAAEYRVGEKTIRRDGRLAMLVDQVVANCGEAARHVLLSRDAGLRRGGLAQLARLSPEKQQAYLAELKATGRRPRRSRSRKPRTWTLPARFTTVYDAAGRNVATVNPLGYRTSNTYDVASRRIRLTDANNHLVTFLFDAADRDLGSVDPLLRRVTFAYDPAGNQVLKLDPRATRISYVYDAINRNTVEQYPTRRVSYSYDAVSNRIGMRDSTGVYTTVFDAKDRTAVAADAYAKRVSYSYDALDRRVQLIDPDNGRFTYSYDPKDRLTVLRNPQGQRTTLQYDAADRQVQEKQANGALTTSTYDGANQLTVRTNAVNAWVVNRFTYSYDPAGNRTGVQEASGDRTTWTYDPTYQLTHEQRSGVTAFNVTHVYDPSGNRVAQNDSGTRTTYSYDAANELTVAVTPTSRTTYSYDPCGNRTQQNAFSAITNYKWDENSRLTEADTLTTPVTFAYNGDGKRMQKQTSTATQRYVYDFEKVLQEADGGNYTTQEYTSTTEQYGDLISAYGNCRSMYYEYDGLGSTDALLDENAVPSSRTAYRAFGQVASQSAASSGFAAALPFMLPQALGGRGSPPANPYGWGGPAGLRQRPGDEPVPAGQRQQLLRPRHRAVHGRRPRRL